jgi:hypothetical protein
LSSFSKSGSLAQTTIALLLVDEISRLRGYLFSQIDMAARRSDHRAMRAVAEKVLPNPRQPIKS